MSIKNKNQQSKNTLNFVDKTIGFFNPTYEFKAQQLRNASSILRGIGVYDGANDSANYQIAVNTSVTDDIVELSNLRDASRGLFKNNGFYEGVIKCSTDHVVGSGLKAKSTINQRLTNLTEKRIKEIEDIFDDYFTSWSESTISDATAKNDFYETQREYYTNYRIDGDSFASLPLTRINENFKVLQVDLIGADLVESKDRTFLEGIKTAKSGLPLKYSILQDDNTHKVINAASKGKKNILHTFKRKRPKQVRGIPAGSSVFRDITFIDEYMKHELQAAKLAALFFGSITSQSKDDEFGDDIDLTTGEQTQTTKNTVKENSITQLSVGDELKIHEQGRDNPNYAPFILTSMQKVASSHRIPLEIILTQFISSYSASRAAMLLMEKFVNPERRMLVNSFCNPIRNQVITWGILQGDIIVPEFFDNRNQLLKCIWLGDPMGSVDPAKDVKAKVSAIDNQLSTRTKATLDLGNGDFETNVKILKKENELLRENDLLEEDNIPDGN